MSEHGANGSSAFGGSSGSNSDGRVPAVWVCSKMSVILFVD